MVITEFELSHTTPTDGPNTLKKPLAQDPEELRRRRGVRKTVIVVVAVAVAIYVGILTGTLAL